MIHTAKQTIFITGAATGIGKQAALELARRGHTVIVTARNRDALVNLQTDAEAEGLTLVYDELDITDTAQTRKLAQRYKVDVLLNNAAIGDTGPVAEVPLNRVRANFEVNVTSTLAMVQAFVPQMIQRRQGRIVVMSSMVGLVTPLFMSPYSASKAALESICASLRMELSYFDIDVVLVNPGRIDGGHNAKIAATKYDWLSKDSPYRDLISEMKQQDDGLLRNAYPISSVVPSIVKAVEAKHPRVHYAAPFKYRLGLFFARLTPSRLQDWVFLKANRLKFLK
jgi:short-subunit dehydrogenase